jgi:hypothetical protein
MANNLDALCDAIKDRDVDQVRNLIQNLQNVNDPSTDNLFPLIIAVNTEYGDPNEEIIRLLIQ